MPTRFAIVVSIGAAILALRVMLSAQHQPHTHRHPAAARSKNPVAASAASIAAGRALYERHCAECHGATGTGDGHAGEGLDRRPSDLTDATWEHGTTDGELFAVIRDGAGPKSEMKGFAKQLSPRETWDVINFVRTLGSTKRHE